MTETLWEYADSRGVSIRVDRRAGVIRGVKILGLRSRNGRVYLPEALRQAVKLYENAKVNVNHPKGDPQQPRDYQDRIGVIRNVVLRENEGLFADFHFNPKHALAEQLLWDAEHAPENVGFSHNVQARCSRRGDQLVVEAITRVLSVDLVADPATTAGLFESQGSQADGSRPERQTTEADGPARQLLADLTLEQLRSRRPDLVEQLCREQLEENRRLCSELQRTSAEVALLKRRQLIDQLLHRHGLPRLDAGDPLARAVLGPRLVQSLLEAQSEQELRELIEERARLVRLFQFAPGSAGRDSSRPEARDQYAVADPPGCDTKAFVEAIT